MTWNNDRERGLVAQVLTYRLRKGVFFVADDAGVPRPTAGLRTHLRSAYSTSEAFMVRLAWDVWNGGGGAKLVHVLESLDSRNRAMVGELVLATVSGDYSAWLLKWSPDEEAFPRRGQFRNGKPYAGEED